MDHPRSILRRHGLDPKKSLGQNFIFDEQIVARIAEAARLQSDDQVLEIGPGLGSLTQQLASRVSRVVVVEIDERLIPLLVRTFGQQDHVEVVHADILQTEPAQYFAGRYKAVGNVPYYITGAILRHLLSGASRPELAVLTVQKEVAERITAEPGDMTLLSVSVQFYAEVERLFVIKAGAFWPRPDVDSAVVRLTSRPANPVPPQEEERFFELVRIGFGQKRKQLQKNLRLLGLPRPQIEEAFAQADIDGRRRAETLSLAEWSVLYSALL